MTREVDSSVDSVTDRALKQMARGVVPVEDPDRVAARRDRLLPSLSAFAGAVIEGRSRRRFWTLSVAVAALVAVMAGAVFRVSRFGVPASPPVLASVHAKQGEVRVSRAGAPAGPIGSARVELVARDRVETADSSAEVNLGSGALVELDTQTRVELGPDVAQGGKKEEHLELSFGKIGLKVPKLPAGNRLTIGTPSARVTVHGTAFEVVVKRLEGGATSTSVSVSEGRVSVESEGREIVLGPGANWSSSPSVDVPPSAAPNASGPEVPTPPPSSDAPKSYSTLARENALFRSAIAARRAGKPARAAEILDRLLAKYPETPLAGAAKAERARAESEVERDRNPGDSPK
jgi:hypothetical protein